MGENYAKFTCSQPGENSMATADTLLSPGQSVMINGETDLSDIIKFNDGGFVRSIKLEKNNGIYGYVVKVDASGPSGPFSGSGYLNFVDRTGDYYKLSITKHKEDEHTVKFNSDKPEITKITWNN